MQIGKVHRPVLTLKQNFSHYSKKKIAKFEIYGDRFINFCRFKANILREVKSTVWRIQLSTEPLIFTMQGNHAYIIGWKWRGIVIPNDDRATMVQFTIESILFYSGYEGTKLKKGLCGLKWSCLLSRQLKQWGTSKLWFL